MVNYGMIGAMILPNVGGWLGGIITSKNIKPWYEVKFPRVSAISISIIASNENEAYVNLKNVGNLIVYAIYIAVSTFPT
jgi:hypothetical protein